MESSPPPTPPPPQKPFDAPSPAASPAARWKPFWRLLLISNFALGAYIFAQAAKRDKIKTADHGVEERKTSKEVSASPKEVSTSPPIDMDTYAEESLLQSLAGEQPIPEEEKW